MPTKALQTVAKPSKKPPAKPPKKLIEELIEAFNESLPEFSRSERVQLAYKAWKESEGAISIRQAARTYGINYTTLLRRTKGALSQEASRQVRQRLSVG